MAPVGITAQEGGPSCPVSEKVNEKVAVGKGQLQRLLAMIQRAKAKVGFCCSTRSSAHRGLRRHLTS